MLYITKNQFKLLSQYLASNAVPDPQMPPLMETLSHLNINIGCPSKIKNPANFCLNNIELFIVALLSRYGASEIGDIIDYFSCEFDMVWSENFCLKDDTFNRSLALLHLLENGVIVELSLGQCVYELRPADVLHQSCGDSFIFHLNEFCHYLLKKQLSYIKKCVDCFRNLFCEQKILEISASDKALFSSLNNGLEAASLRLKRYETILISHASAVSYSEKHRCVKSKCQNILLMMEPYRKFLEYSILRRQITLNQFENFFRPSAVPANSKRKHQEIIAAIVLDPNASKKIRSIEPAFFLPSHDNALIARQTNLPKKSFA